MILIEKILLLSSPDWATLLLEQFWPESEGDLLPQRVKVVWPGFLGDYLLKLHPQVCALSTIPLLQSMLEQ